jgi:macrodomain Ter protein organizer (MatP/YcbG family)
MADDYQYDVFISYRRPNPVGDWVKNHFHPLLVEWLSQAMPYEP